jgi:hypothetical protein
VVEVQEHKELELEELEEAVVEVMVETLVHRHQ